jgi:hypothetical protein
MIEKAIVSIDTVDPIVVDPIPIEDRRDYVRDIYSEHDRGTDILLAIVHATSFRKAVLEVADIAGKPWCYDRATKLREVYRMTRRRRSNGRVHS